MIRRTVVVATLSVTACAGPADPGPADPGAAVTVRVIDVGPGLCTITTAPSASGPRHMVYDAGHWFGGLCLDAVDRIVGTAGVDLMIISHSDGDHLGDAEEIIEAHDVRAMIRTGDSRHGANLDSMVFAIGREVTAIGAMDRSLATQPITPGETLALGDATLTLLHGLNDWTASSLSDAESNNAISIVVRLDYNGGSVLFSGDVIGRRLDDPAPNACRDAEEMMVNRHTPGTATSLDSDVIIAPHHGGNNGSSTCFINAVSPSAVVFSAGHQYLHPTVGAAGRYLAANVRPDSLFRTDLGDDEDPDDPPSHPDAEHWEPGGATNCADARGDDEIEIHIDATGAVTVRYVTMSTTDCS